MSSLSDLDDQEAVNINSSPTLAQTSLSGIPWGVRQEIQQRHDYGPAISTYGPMEQVEVGVALESAEAIFDPRVQHSMWLPAASRAPTRDEQPFGPDLQAAISNSATLSIFVPTAEGDSMIHTPQPPYNTSFQPEYRDALLAASGRQPRGQWGSGSAPPTDGYTHTVPLFTASAWGDTLYNDPVQRSPSYTDKYGNDEAAFNSTTVPNDFHQPHEIRVGDPTPVIPTENNGVLPAEPDTQLGGSATSSTAIPNSFLSLVTTEGRCKYLNDGQPCQTVPRAERKEFFVRHILNVHILKEMRHMDDNLLTMEDAEILTTPEKLQRAKDYLWHCPSCSQISMRQDAIKSHIRQLHWGESLIPVQKGANLRRGIRAALNDILAA